MGGFDVGSDITWHAQASYNIDTTLFGHPVTGQLGYRALYVDYDQGSGTELIGIDLLFHGPVVGLTMKW